MKKVKYYYNTNTLRYEKLDTPLRVRLLRVFAFLATAVVTSGIIISLSWRYINSPKEQKLVNENKALRDNYRIIEEKVKSIEVKQQELEKRDNDVYRSIFEASPIPDSARAKALENLQEQTMVLAMSEIDLFKSLTGQLQLLSNRMANQNNSYNQIDGMIKNKEAFLRSIPAIQPISNQELTRIASGFGYRTDPVYKVTKFHAGLDFTAPQGTPIYATADGVVTTSGYSEGGYGNHVVIKHEASGYETLYGHMVRIKAGNGAKVKRGEVIGWVGSTGKSTGPHCHYEVRKGGNKLDPVYFFHNDLSPEQYNRLLKLAQTVNQSFD
jgi:murein DD-endopeptidase MepM/ murein hydrolase activator NlpD